MFLNFLNFFQNFLSQIRIPFLCSFIFLLLFSLIFSISIMPISLHTNTESLPVKSKQNLQTEYIKENTDKFLISTKDGYLHALNNDKKEIWKVYLEQELMSSTLSTRKINKDLYLYPMNERLYIYQNGNFIPFTIFVKDLVERHYLSVNDFTLLGKTKTTLFIIDIDNGDILQKIDDENDFSFKKRYILSKNRNTITVVRIDYILSCMDLEDEQKFWNTSFSDIIIQNSNGNSESTKIFTPNLQEIINEYRSNTNNNDISLDNVITAYSYFNKDIPLVKIFDISYKNNELEGEIKQLTEYNNINKFRENDNIKLETKLKYLENISKNNGKMKLHEPLKLPNYMENQNKIYDDNIDNNIYSENKTQKNNSLFLFLKENIIWVLIGIIIVLFYKLNYYKFFYITMKKENEEKDKILYEKEKIIRNNINNINNDNQNNNLINNENKVYNINEKSVKLQKRQYDNNSQLLHHKKTFDNIYFKKKLSFDDTNKNTPDNYENNNYKTKIININENEKEKNNIINKESQINAKENSIDNKEYKNEIINSNNNSQNIRDEKENASTNKESNGIWDDDDDNDDDSDNNNDNNNKEERLNKSEEKGIKKDENNVENNEKIEKNEIKSKNGIWDDDEDEDEEEDNNNKEKEKQNDKEVSENQENSKYILKSKNNSSIIITDNSNTSYENKETNEYINPRDSKEINNNNKKGKKKQNRLDMDFENLEKIGQGGFGIVLKGRHKIDQDFYAIKIIDVTYNSRECDEIVSEAKKMNAIKGEYIVNYTICWYDDNLGSAEKFFDKKDNNSPSYFSNKLSQSITIHLTKREENSINIKNTQDIFNIQELDEDNFDDNCNNNINKSIKNKNSDENSNRNNSLELLENKNNNQIYNNRSKYCFEFMDDSKLSNRSILSKRYESEIYQKKQKKYFFILMEYCDGLTLEIFISQHSNKSIERKIIYNYTKQILKGLKKLHKNGIIHRDIKPGNIFIKNEQIKIGDFGLATNFQKNTILQTKDLKGFTPTYAAPEQTNSKTYNEKIDIYACGITLFEMCGCFGTEMERQLALKDLKSKRIILDRIIKDYPQESELIKMMTEKDYNERPSAEQILKSDLFAELGKIVT